MQFPIAFVPWVEKQFAAGRTLEQMRDRLTTTMGYTPHVAETLLAAAFEGSSHLRLPALGERPDVRRNAEACAPSAVETLPGVRSRILAELAAPQLLVFQRFLSDEVIRALHAQLDGSSTRVDRYVQSDRATQDWLLPDTGAAQLCLSAAAHALNWPRPRWGLPLVRETMQGQGFNLHYDAFGTGAVDDTAFKAVHGDNARIGTLLICLQPAGAGGSTYFANLGLRVALDVGDALYFGYPRDDLARSGVLHGGEEVYEGTKRLMTLFCYQRDLHRGGAASKA